MIVGSKKTVIKYLLILSLASPTTPPPPIRGVSSGDCRKVKYPPDWVLG